MWENLGLNVPIPVTPKAMDLPRMTLKQPVPDVPAYKPMIIPPSDLEAPEGVQAEEKETTEQPEVRKLDIPVIDIEFPLPSGEIVATAVTTAVVAVATTTVAQTFFEPIQKQVKKQLQKRVDAWKKKRKENKEKVSSVS